MIANIRLQNFRSYADTSFEFDEGTNIIVGPNASGKTNLLEAISVISRGRSFRARDAELIRYQAPWARLDAFMNNEAKVVRLYADGPVGKELQVNNKVYKRLTKDFVSPVVLFEPNDLAMLYGSPDARRSYLDGIVEYENFSHANTLKDYTRTLAQRNRLLKQANISVDGLFVWNVRLSELADKLAGARMKTLATINQDIASVYSQIADKPQQLELRLKTSCNPKQYGTSMMHLLEKSQQLDLERGFTGVGPHRDDIEIVLNKVASGQSASRGEFRTILLSLKVIELQVLETITGEAPILLLDDVFSELDGKRRHQLTDYVRKYQSFITTTDADIVARNFVQKAKVSTILIK